MSFSPKNLKTKKRKNGYKNFLFLSIFFASSVLAAFLWSSQTFAATGINKQISFQGKVVNADGTNVSNGSYDFVFKLYTVSSGGAAVWTETRTGGSQVTVTDGIFQVDLGSVTTLPGSVDFNTDNIYLGIEFNSDGEMSPRVHFTAAPYAFNARTVGGLTVTDTTGTLTIPSGKTISFADAFTTSGAFATTLTATATTNVTLPTTGTLATLAGSESLTNKTIGSTGLVFSGATTDITTASGESLVITAAGAGTIDLQDATTVDSLTADTGGVSIAAGQSYTGAGAVTLSSGGSSGLTLDSASGRVAVATGDFLSLSVSGVSGAAAGDIWYDSAANKFKINENGTTKILCNTTDAGCGGGGVTADSLDFIDLEDTLDLDAALTLNQTTNTWSQTFTGTTTTGLTYTANSLTSGSALAIASSSVAMTGSLESITLSGSNAANTGNLLLIADTGALNTTTPFKLTANGAATQVAALIENTGSGTALRINDEASDSTPFLIDADGNIAIGTTSVPAATKFTIQTNPWDATGDYRNLYNLAIYNSSTNNTGSIVNDYNQLDISGTGNKNNAIAGYNWLSHSSSGTLDSVGIGTSSYFYTTGGNVNEGIGERARINNAGSATILSGIAFDAMVDNTSTGTITSAYGLRVAMTNSGGGTVTTGYGIYLGDSTGTTDYGIYQAGSNDYNYFTGNTGFGDATPASLLTVGSGDAFQVNSSGAIVATTGVTSSGAIAANGGITFDNSSDTLGAFTLGGTVDANANILTNIGNTGTDFVASTGALTLAGVLTANGGITLSASQSISAAALAYIDLGSIVHNTTANQGLRLPNAASASPSAPTSGEGYLAWDAAGNQLITYDGSSWATLSGGSGYNLIKDESTSLTARTTLAFLGAGVSCADNASQTECTISGGGSSDLQTTYGNDADGSNVTISLTSADDGIVFSNPASSGTDSAFTFKVEQLNTGIDNDALYIDNRGTGDGLRIDDESGDTTPFIVDKDGRVGIGTTSISSAAATERLLQVGSETNRGNSVTYGEVVTKGQRDITALTNIKDIYVYDTTADSDGGRWIDWATTDKLSWYTEALDDSPSDSCVIATDDRCYKAAFPRKAILVVTTDALYIFDAQDNALWMKFSQNDSGYALGADTNNDPSSVTALNGVIYVGTNGASAGGLYAFDFTTDRMWKYDSTDRSQGDVGIGSRNSAVTYNSDNNTQFDLGNDTGWDAVNDVSVATMQFSTTAIAIGTTTNIGPGNGSTLVAVATDSGLGVINLSRQRYVAYSDATDDNYNAVVITRTAKLYGLNNTLDQAEKWINIDQDQVSEENGTPDKVWDQASTPALSKTQPAISSGAPDALEVVERGSLADGGLLSTAAAAGSSDLIYVGTDQGLTEIHDHSTPASGWSKFFNTTKQSALMPGTIKRAHMMDDASGDLTDDSFRANTMAPIGGVTYGINGVRGKAVTLNGTSGFFCSDNGGATCAADTDDNMSTTAWNMQMWFKHSVTQAGTDVLYSRCYNTTPAAAAACVTVYMTSTGTMVAAYDDDATWTAYSSYDAMLTSTRTYNDNQWHHMVMARDNANDLHFFIDGTPIVSNNATGSTLTLDASQIVSIGADCSVGAACATGANFWDGSIDDFTFSQGTTTVDALTGAQARRLYNDARPLLNKKVITVTDATTATSTTIGDSGETWIPNEFASQIVEITSDTGAGQTRRIVANTTTTLTVSPAFSTVPDTTSDFEINPEILYGASNTVTAIGVTGESAMGEARQLCVGTNSATDTGGVTCLNHQAGPNLVADMYHGDSEQTDDSGAEWTGTDYDDIQSIDISGRAMVIGSMAHFWTETEDVRLGQGMDYLSNKIFDLTNVVKNLGMQTLAGSGSMEVGLTGGADLAEHYYSNESLSAGEVVAIDTTLTAGVKKTTGAYQKDTLGIVATEPGIILGTGAENSYPITLVGRVPVKITNENGPIYAGDRLTSASRPGYAMRATQAGRVIGEALADAIDWTVCEGEDPQEANALLCTTVLVFVNLTDYSGQSVELAMAEREKQAGADGLSDTKDIDEAEQGLGSETASIRLATSMPTKQEKILDFLKDLDEKQKASGQVLSEVFTGRVAASREVITPTLYADQIFARSIKAGSIEGLDIFTDKIGSLEEKYAGLDATVTDSSATTQAVKEQLAIAMEKLSVETLSVNLDGSILGNLSVTGALQVGGAAEFGGETVFAKLVNFLDTSVFKGMVSFEKAPLFASDTAGFAIIEKGARKVKIVFDTPYERQPIVTVTLTREVSPLLEDADEDLKQDIAILEEEYVGAVFNENIRYVVTEKSERGFTIVLSEKAAQDLQFSWVALAVDKAKSFNSEPEIEEIVPVVIPVDTTVTPLNPETPPVETAPVSEDLINAPSVIEETAEEIP